jgi:hypothetical protein
MTHICPCGKSFKKPYLLKRHQSAINPCSYIDQIRLNDSKSTNNENNIEDDNTCDICEKKLCNKYTLKYHKIICQKIQ